MRFDSLRHLKPEQLIGLMFVLALHGAGLYGLWKFRVIPAPEEAVTLMVNLINPPRAEQAKPPKPEPPRPRAVDPPPPEHTHLAAEAPVVQPDEPVAYVPPPEPRPPRPETLAVAEAQPMPPQPVVLSGELSVVCAERSPPDYPRLSMRMNEQGKAVLRVELDEDGRVAAAEVKTSSGYRRLDDAALNTVKTWRCKPSVRNGVAVRAVALQPFNFVLEGR